MFGCISSSIQTVTACTRVCERVLPCWSDGSAVNDGLTRWSIRSLCRTEKRWYKFHPLFGLFRLCRGRLWLLLGALLINTVKPQMNGSLSVKWVHVFIKAANPHAFVSEASWGTEQIHLKANCLIRLIWSQISDSVLLRTWNQCENNGSLFPLGFTSPYFRSFSH